MPQPTPAQIRRVRHVYAEPRTATEYAVASAVIAVDEGRCASPVVGLGLANLVTSLEQRHELPDYERAERYLAECWREHLVG